jgi:hypothetical protein
MVSTHTPGEAAEHLEEEAGELQAVDRRTLGSGSGKST